MKLNKFLIGCLIAFFSNAYADNHHVHPEKGDTAPENQVPSIKAKYAGFCEIEIINQSYDDVRVNGVFDDGMSLEPFTIYSYESPHYISLYFYGYCHYGMNLYIDSFYGYNLYSGYTTRESTIRIVPYLKNRAKADIIKR
jgi:hypothetical protein